jgi:ABC-2 type transport system permease protein
LSPRLDFSALGTLFVLTLQQHRRGRRLLLLALLFALPAVIAVVTRAANPSEPVRSIELHLLLTLMPSALLPLAALLYATGMIQDEVEEQTLTYLLVRPLPRRLLYLTKLLATYLMSALLAGVFAVITCAAIYWGQPEFWGTIVPGRALTVAALFALALFAYCAVFGLIGLYTRYALVAGIAYVILFEGMLGGFAFIVRRLTVMYHFRVLCMRWLDLARGTWGLDLADAPSAASSVLTLLLVGVAAALLASAAFARREFRMKTPEGS